MIALLLLQLLTATPAQQALSLAVEVKLAINSLHALEAGRIKPPGDPRDVAWESGADRLEHIVIQAVIIPLHDLAETTPQVAAPEARRRLRKGLADARALIATLPADRTPSEVGALARLEATFVRVERLPQVRVPRKGSPR